MSLRTRLVAGMLLVVAIGLGIAALVTYRLVQSVLVQNLDDELVASQLDVFRQLGGDAPARAGGLADGRPGRPMPFVAVAPGTYGEWRTASGDVFRVSSPVDGEELAPPDLEARIPDTGAAFERHFTAGSTGDGPEYRVYVRTMERNAGTLVVARPLTDVKSTLGRLVVIEGGVAGGVLVLAGLLAFVVIRVGLRPLDRVVETADAIAAGDLSQRVPFANPRTEVGHLGRAFNAMIGSIQESMRRREVSEQRLRTFVADASHELRTPLTSLSGYSEMLGRPDLGAEDRELAGRRLREASGRMSRLVDDMLTLARLDEEPPRFTEPVDLAEVVEAAVDDARAADPGRELEADLAAGTIVHGNRDQLARIAGNLLRNVRVHTLPGVPAGVRVRSEGSSAVLEVWDRGPGVAADMKDRVFERFFRVDKSRARERGGAGLGLSIVASIVAAHDGTIMVDDNPGGGALFRVVLPLAVGASSAP